MTLRSRLVLALVTMAALLVAPLFIAYDSLDNMRAAVRGLQQQYLSATLLLARIRTAAEELRQAELQLAYAPDSAAITRPDARVTTALNAVRAMSDSLDHFGLDGTRKEISATLDQIALVVRRAKLRSWAHVHRPENHLTPIECVYKTSP